MRKYRKVVGDLRAEVSRRLSDHAIGEGHVATSEIAASILIDHSGSLSRFGNAENALCVSETLSLYFAALGIRHEILGFTTDSWRGGRSRELWMRQGEPDNPGRLCDLLHIIYKTHDDEVAVVPRALQNLLRPQLLKENVDGEALEWAASRLRSRPERSKILIHVSDGAPVDDSSIYYNHDTILYDHLMDVISRLEGDQELTLGAIGVHFRVDGYYSHSAFVESIAEAPIKTIDLAEALLIKVTAH